MRSQTITATQGQKFDHLVSQVYLKVYSTEVIVKDEERQTILANYTRSTTNSTGRRIACAAKRAEKTKIILGNSEFGTDVEPAGSERERKKGKESLLQFMNVKSFWFT